MHFDRLKKIETVGVADVQAPEIFYESLSLVLKGRCTKFSFIRDDLSDDTEGDSDGQRYTLSMSRRCQQLPE